MTRIMSPSVGRAGRLVLLGSLLLTAMCGATFAETTDAVTPAAAPAETAAPAEPAKAEPAKAEPAKAEPAQDDCQPIGLTASGEIVYPFHCKAFIEQRKAEAKPAAVEEKPAAAQVMPAAAPDKPAEEKAAAKLRDQAAPKTAAVEAAPAAAHTPKSAEGARVAHERGIGPAGCSHFRSYQATTATYLAFDGQRHPCREVASAQSAKR
jgi:BA14K-like protein